MLTGLTFLPPQDAARGFAAVCIEIRTNFGNVADELLAYFEDTYVGRFRLNAPRNDPIFSIKLWNMFHRTDAGFDKPIIARKAGIVAFKGLCHHVIPVYGSFYQP